ncbi:MAG: cupin domain-containing protein [Candidatus Nanoarchaeia archaeon]|nr:cupin domain-containing protein [Candidatus Nanoarchaeia archaeon]MDD5588127.1 cupin domain-containing protein [Candidatus Nanoarchaeia archaeon]
MKKFLANQDGWYCGYWNNSPLQIKYSSGRPLKKEKVHLHNFSEYYLVLNGTLTLEIDKKIVKVGKLELLMIESGESHKIVKKEPKSCSYVIIKEKSYSNNKK